MVIKPIRNKIQVVSSDDESMGKRILKPIPHLHHTPTKEGLLTVTVSYVNLQSTACVIHQSIEDHALLCDSLLITPTIFFLKDDSNCLVISKNFVL